MTSSSVCVDKLEEISSLENAFQGYLKCTGAGDVCGLTGNEVYSRIEELSKALCSRSAQEEVQVLSRLLSCEFIFLDTDLTEWTLSGIKGHPHLLFKLLQTLEGSPPPVSSSVDDMMLALGLPPPSLEEIQHFHFEQILTLLESTDFHRVPPASRRLLQTHLRALLPDHPLRSGT
jgi:hypothetical protein